MTRTSTSAVILAAGLFLGAAASGCATVRPWQRGRLSDSCMIFDADPGQAAYTAHWQEAREASTGGSGAQSGGCGCK